MQQHSQLTRFAWLSLGTAVLTIALKVGAYQLTGSVGLLSDGLESGVNLVTAVVALITLIIAARPPDKEHAFGHSKAEYFSGGLEGVLILAAAGLIVVTAVPRLLNPHPLEQVGLGLFVSLIAAFCNGLTAFVLLRAGRRYRSLTLRANGRHLLTDVWTTGGVLLGIAIVGLTGWLWLDAVIALVVAVQISMTGFGLVREAVNGLMDKSLPAEEVGQVKTILGNYEAQGIHYHALRTRQAGAQRFVSVHIQVPGKWSVQRGHTLLEKMECDLCHALAPVSVLTHLEPAEDPLSWADMDLNRDFV
ncbi:MAG: cation transporter [Chloroflexi bacterium]|nr:cation transporter [Chloroflexota bacterium]